MRDDRATPALTLAEWHALPPHMRIAQRLAAILLLLDTIRDEIYTEQGCSLLWMEDALELVSNEADWMLMKLSV
jgi:hypothetical protein